MRESKDLRKCAPYTRAMHACNEIDTLGRTWCFAEDINVLTFREFGDLLRKSALYIGAGDYEAERSSSIIIIIRNMYHSR